MANGKFPYFRLWVNDLEGSFWVQRMSDRQFGWFLRLLVRSWHSETPCYISNNPDVLFDLSGCDDRAYWDEHSGLVLDRFNTTEDGLWRYNRKLRDEYDSIAGVVTRRKLAGRKGGQSKALAMLEQTSSNATQPESDSEPEPEKDKHLGVVKGLFDYYLERVGRNATTYRFTDLRKQKGLSRLRECIKRAKAAGAVGDSILAQAERAMRVVIDKAAASPFHNGRNDRQQKYLDWEGHLFKSEEQMEKWWNR